MTNRHPDRVYIQGQERTDTPQDHAKGEGRTGVTLWLKGKPVQFKVVPQCRVCQAKDRDIIEHGLMIGYGYGAIVKSLPADSELLKSRDGKTTFDTAQVTRLIGQHSRKGHAYADAVVARTIQEEWAKRAGLDVDVSESIVTELGLLSEVLRRSWQALVESDEPIPLAQGIRAAEILLTYRDIASDMDANVFREGGEAMFRVLRTMFDDETVQQIFHMMEADSTIQNAFLALQAAN